LLLCFEAPRHHPSTRSYETCVWEAQALLLLLFAPYRRVAGPGAPLFADLITVGCLSGGFDMRRGCCCLGFRLSDRLQGCSSVCRAVRPSTVVCLASLCVCGAYRSWGKYLGWFGGWARRRKKRTESSPHTPRQKHVKIETEEVCGARLRLQMANGFTSSTPPYNTRDKRRGGGCRGGRMDQMSKGICAGTDGRGLAAPAQPPDGLEPHRPWEGLDEMHNIVRHQSDATWCDRLQKGARRDREGNTNAIRGPGYSSKGCAASGLGPRG
jgi:hypothetical protein